MLYNVNGWWWKANTKDNQVKLFLTWLSEDVWVSYCHSCSVVIPSVFSFKLPCDKLGLLGLKRVLNVGSHGQLLDQIWRILPETQFGLARVLWDAAEREHSDYRKNPSHLSKLGNPRRLIRMKRVSFNRQPTHWNVLYSCLSWHDSYLTLSLL